jgi:hypothetical protein
VESCRGSDGRGDGGGEGGEEVVPQALGLSQNQVTLKKIQEVKDENVTLFCRLTAHFTCGAFD